MEAADARFASAASSSHSADLLRDRFLLDYRGLAHRRPPRHARAIRCRPSSTDPQSGRRNLPDDVL